MRFKRMSEIYSRLVDDTITSTNEINDFSVGSAMRAIYEAISIELEQFYVLSRENILESIEQGVYSSFGFNRKAAQRAYGVVQIQFHNATQSPLTISRGSRFSCSSPEYSQVYETRQAYLIPQGSFTADVEVFCRTAGEIGNVPEGTIDTMHSPIANLREVINPDALQTGQNEEPVEELRSRFRSYIRSLSKATIPALEYGTRTVAEVSGVYVEEQTGLITIYAHDRNGNLPDKVKADILEKMEDYRPAGIPVRVKPVTRREVDVEVTITLTNKNAISNRFRTQIEREIQRYLNNMQTSQHLILSDLSSVIKYIDRQAIYDVRFTEPKDNTYLKGSEIIRAGKVNVTLK